jgi:acyl-CoA thioesterase FadM
MPKPPSRNIKVGRMSKTVVIKRKILFGDCDPEGIVYTPRFSYFAVEAIHDALSVWLKGPGLKTLMGFDILPPARALSLEFFYPITWDDELKMNVSVANVGEHSFSFLVEGFITNDISVFIANITHVCVSPDTKKVMKVPERLRALLLK